MQYSISKWLKLWAYNWTSLSKTNDSLNSILTLTDIWRSYIIHLTSNEQPYWTCHGLNCRSTHFVKLNTVAIYSTTAVLKDQMLEIKSEKVGHPCIDIGKLFSFIWSTVEREDRVEDSLMPFIKMLNRCKGGVGRQRVWSMRPCGSISTRMRLYKEQDQAKSTECDASQKTKKSGAKFTKAPPPFVDVGFICFYTTTILHLLYYTIYTIVRSVKMLCDHKKKW